MYIIKDIFKDLYSDETAYILGYIYADGCIAKNNALIFCSIDLELIEKVKAVFETNSPIKTKMTSGFDRGCLNYRLEICRKKICDYLRELGVKNPNFFPKFYLDTPYIHSYVRGVFDGDGCISINQNPEKSRNHKIYNKPTCNIILHETVLENFEKYFSSIGIYVGQQDSHTPYMKYLKFSSKSSSRIFANTIYKDSKIHLNRKYQKFMLIGPSDSNVTGITQNMLETP